jgi:hypothetical protein
MPAGRPAGLPKTGGRRKGVPNKATAEIRALAQQNASAAMAELVRLATKAKSEQTRVAAIKEILDRAYGKATQPIANDEGGEGSLKVQFIKRVIVDPTNSAR